MESIKRDKGAEEGALKRRRAGYRCYKGGHRMWALIGEEGGAQYRRRKKEEAQTILKLFEIGIRNHILYIHKIHIAHISVCICTFI